MKTSHFMEQNGILHNIQYGRYIIQHMMSWIISVILSAYNTYILKELAKSDKNLGSNGADSNITQSHMAALLCNI